MYILYVNFSIINKFQYKIIQFSDREAADKVEKRLKVLGDKGWYIKSVSTFNKLSVIILERWVGDQVDVANVQ